ncbi:PEP-CTERM sorting domain-containing protein [bacterium]|nr:PEP-CTERM sorting domain-containing protein [bacterium]
MKLKQTKVATLAATLITFGSLAGGANAALTITNFDLQSTSISFDISGTIEGPAPSEGLSYLFFVDANGNGDYDDAPFQTPTIAQNIAVNGSTPAVSSMWIENADITEDRITLHNDSLWNVGDVLSGSFSASWASPIDTAPLTNGMEVRWGRNKGTALQGTLQGTASAVPEPSSALLLGLSTLGVVARRKRNA